MIKVYRYILITVLFSWCNLAAIPYKHCYKQAMLGDLEVIKHILEVEYAPMNWKSISQDWNLEQAYTDAKEAVIQNPHLSIRQFHDIVKQFLGTTCDYHVNVYFHSTESATLPFTIKGVNQRYFVDWVDEKRLSKSIYLISKGDELLSFNELPVYQVIEKIKNEMGRFARSATDQSLAELSLTYRSGERGEYVPKGGVNLTFKSAKTQQIYSYQLMWDYKPEYIFHPHLATYIRKLTLCDLYSCRSKKELWNPIAQLHNHPMCESHGIGKHKSRLPHLGKLIKTMEDSPFYSYIYQTKQNYTIGYLRIPHYKIRDNEIDELGTVIQELQEQTDALVIDQLDNPGGYVESQYLIASMLTKSPLITPRHRLSISQQDVAEALAIVELLDTIKTDEDAEEVFGGNEILQTHQHALFLKDFYSFILQEWSQGHTLTNPIHIEGIDHINPHPQFRYTKPIVVLINELDFSGGDFFPAIMQDNKRAILFGTRTAGAGGFVKIFEFPNYHGIAGFSYTASIAERYDQQPIEDLGVTPDIECSFTEEDLQYKYQHYIKRLHEVIHSLLNQTTVDS